MNWRFFVLMISVFIILIGCANDNATTPTNEVQITGISPVSLKIGDTLTIKGLNFGTTQDTNFVLLNNTLASVYLSWNNTQIKIIVPTGASSGKILVNVNGKTSNEKNFTIIITNSSGIKTVLIPAGNFIMGNTGAYIKWSNELPSHPVTLTKSFYMGIYEVVQSQWKSVMGDDPSFFKGDSLPIENVNWYKAIEFCNKLSEKDGLAKCYTINGIDVICDWKANGWRLPTEAEWEYSCKAGTTSDFYNGSLTNEYSADDNLDLIAWYRRNSFKKTIKVGQKLPNNFGLYDMSGSVWEWCWDLLEEYKDKPVTDPTGSIPGSQHALRGGSWDEDPYLCTSATRYFEDPGTIVKYFGFRIVRNK
jgi:formylglycine-generating enzyme required for sulfatase activity